MPNLVTLLLRNIFSEHLRLLEAVEQYGYGNWEDIIRKLRGPGDVLFYSSPCTGGSTWQRLNLALAKRKHWDNTIVRIIYHRDLHWKLWERFEQVVKHCRQAGATVLLEWPRFREYWHEKRVSQFLLEMTFLIHRLRGMHVRVSLEPRRRKSYAYKEAVENCVY